MTQAARLLSPLTQARQPPCAVAQVRALMAQAARRLSVADARLPQVRLALSQPVYGLFVGPHIGPLSNRTFAPLPPLCVLSPPL